MDRLLRDSTSTIRIEFRDSAGVPVNVDPAASVTAAITDSAGTALSGSPFTAVAVVGVAGTYQVTLIPAKLAVLDTYDVTWSGTIGGEVQKRYATYEVVGGFLFGIAELRGFDKDLTADKYSAAQVVVARERAEETMEKECAVAFRPRGRRVILSGNGRSTLILPDRFPRKIVSASIDAVVLSAAKIADIARDASGVITRKTAGDLWTAGVANVVVFYEFGIAEPPEPVRQATMMLAREALVDRMIPARATALSTDQGVLRFSLAGRDGPTGIPDVDAVIAAQEQTTPVFA